jgi:hypothetical protein
MNNKASPPCTDASKKCRDLFPYFPSLESRLAGEHTVVYWKRVDTRDEHCRLIQAAATAIRRMPGIFQRTTNSWRHIQTNGEHFQKLLQTLRRC